MKYYIDENNHIYAYELDGSQDYLIADKSQITKEEAEKILNPPQSKEELVIAAEIEKQHLISIANNIITPLSDAVELDMATDEEVAQLKAWKVYRVLLTRVDTNLAPDIEWPQIPA